MRQYESVIKATIDYQSYKSVQEKALPKFKYYAKCMAELKKTLDEVFEKEVIKKVTITIIVIFSIKSAVILFITFLQP